MSNPIAERKKTTKDLALAVDPADVFDWLLDHGYFPESYVLPPCFRVTKRPSTRKRYFEVKTEKGKTRYVPNLCEPVEVSFPKSELTDRTFGIIDPHLHHDIALQISENWGQIVEALIPGDSAVTSYSFPIPVDARNPGRLTVLRSGRSIYEFIEMTDDDLATVAYQYTHIVKADTKSFYPTIYTHSIAWALHGKAFIRTPPNRHDYNLLGNRLDKLFQSASDGRTNGIPIGPVVSDVAAEILAAAVDRRLTALLADRTSRLCMVRFKDDYRILLKTRDDANTVIGCLQRALREFNLELSDDKTRIESLPNGLFRPWVSRYHAVNPEKRDRYTWKQFREIYLAVVEIDRSLPGTGVIDRFLADIVNEHGQVRVELKAPNLQKVMSMLIMLGTLRAKAFPKVIAVLESILKSPLGSAHRPDLVAYLEQYLKRLSEDEVRNRYLISWIWYFFVSNRLTKMLSFSPTYTTEIVTSVFKNGSVVHKKRKDFSLFVNSKTAAKRISMLEHLDVFNPPNPS